MGNPPACYAFSESLRKRKLREWADSFDRHGDRVRDRILPVLLLDRIVFVNKEIAAWVSVGGLKGSLSLGRR